MMSSQQETQDKEMQAYLLERLRQAADWHETIAKHSCNGWHDGMAVTLRQVSSALSTLQAQQETQDRLNWERHALASAIRFVRAQEWPHSEAVSDCPHCHVLFIASWAQRAEAALSTLQAQQEQHQKEITPTPDVGNYSGEWFTSPPVAGRVEHREQHEHVWLDTGHMNNRYCPGCDKTELEIASPSPSLSALREQLLKLDNRARQSVSELNHLSHLAPDRELRTAIYHAESVLMDLSTLLALPGEGQEQQEQDTRVDKSK